MVLRSYFHEDAACPSQSSHPIQRPQAESPYHVEVLTGMAREDWMNLKWVWYSAIRRHIELHWDPLIRVLNV